MLRLAVRVVAMLACAALSACAGKTAGNASSLHGDASLDDGSTLDALPRDSAQRVPKRHRPAALGCPTTRAAGNGHGKDCRSDAECNAGNNGRCIGLMCDCVQIPCSYDECFVDAECSAGATCACRGEYQVYGMLPDAVPNVCIAGNCRTDADCGSTGYCSPSYDADCGRVLRGWFCHTKGDVCIDDDDCTPTKAFATCNYDPVAGHWGCSRGCGAG